VDLAINLVNYDNKFKKAFSFALGNTLVVNDVHVGRRIGIGVAKMVTLEGDLMNLSGAMRGGFRNKRKGMGFNEIEVGKNIDQLENQIASLRTELTQFMSQRENNEDLIQNLEKRRIRKEILF